MTPSDMGLRRGLGVLLTGIGLIGFANFLLLMGLLVGSVASGGPGGFVVAGLAAVIVGLVTVFVGAATLAERPRP